MYFSTLVAFAALPFLVRAVPASLNSPRIVGLKSIPLSRRSNHLNGDGSVDLENLHAGVHHTMARLDQAFSMYERNTGELHPLALKRGRPNERRGFVPLSLTGGLNTVTGEIQVGTPAKAFTVHFDTFSSAVFLAGIYCSTCKGTSCSTCNTQNIYDPSTSSTATSKTGNETFVVDFRGIAKVDAELVSDDFFVAGFKVVNQPILVALNLDTDGAFRSSQFPADGVVGLGFGQLADITTDSLFGSLIKQGGIVPVFGLSLAESGSALVIGGTDTSRLSGSLTYVNLDNPGLWQIPFDSISVNGNVISVSTKEVLLDTSSTVIIGDSKSISNIYANIPGSARAANSSQWIIPCNTAVTVTVAFGGTTFNIPPSAYNLGAVSKQNSTCVGGFSDISEPFWIFGTVFLQSVYTEFDQGNLRVGFAPPATA